MAIRLGGSMGQNIEQLGVEVAEAFGLL